MAPNPVTPSPHPEPGLPPVQPPSGQMILRLFLVPGLIVGVLVVLFLAGPGLARWFNNLIGRPSADARSADEFLRDLDSANPDIRYRAASDLAQVLLRKDELAADPDFALALADRLADARGRMAAAEKDFTARVGSLDEGARAAEEKKLGADRNLATFLGACLGNCMTPVGVPLLKDMALQGSGMEEDALADQRRRALFALANLGENLRRYDKLPDGDKDAIARKLEAAADAGQAARARPTLEYLKARRAGKPDTMGVADALAQCARDDDPALREYAAFTSNFWQGNTAEGLLVEGFLKELAVDNGRGEEKLDARKARNPNTRDSRPITKRPGFGVRVNATIALARRGSPDTRLGVLKEVLSPDELRQVFVLRNRGGEESPDEAMVAQTVLNALKATAELARKRPEMKAKLAELAPLVEALAQDRNTALSHEAAQTKLALAGG